jgi:hypothetical protein
MSSQTNIDNSMDKYRNSRAADRYVAKLKLQQQYLQTQLDQLAGEPNSEQRKKCPAEFMAQYNHLKDLRDQEDIYFDEGPWEHIWEDEWAGPVIWPVSDDYSEDGYESSRYDSND